MLIQFVHILIGFAVLLRNVEGATDQSKLKDLCGAVLELRDVYNRDCETPKTTNTTANPGSPLYILCAVIASRFANSEDITETDQATDQKRHLNRVEHEDLCSQGTDDGHIQAVISHLQRAIKYFGALRSQHVNTALVGTRTTQAQIALYFEHWQESAMVNDSTWPSASLLKQLKDLALQAKEASWMIEKNNDDMWSVADKSVASSFFRKMPLRNSWKDWDILASKEVHLAPQFKNLTRYHKDHELNNECYENMTKDCSLTQDCADILLDQSAVLTTLGHNMLFFQTAIRMECVQEVDFMDKFPNGDWQSALEHHCATMWNEANVISNADFPTGYKGLFLLHGSMCASTGYPNFLSVDWMNHVMSWMASTVNGCIPPDTKPGTAPDAVLVDPGFDDFAENGEWCSIYETSRAIIVLSLHLRYLLESCLSN